MPDKAISEISIRWYFHPSLSLWSLTIALIAFGTSLRNRSRCYCQFYSSSFVAPGSWVESIDSTWSSIKSSILANSFSRTLSTYNAIRKLTGLFFSSPHFRLKLIWNVTAIVAISCSFQISSHIFPAFTILYSSLGVRRKETQEPFSRCKRNLACISMCVRQFQAIL